MPHALRDGLVSFALGLALTSCYRSFERDVPIEIDASAPDGDLGIDAMDASGDASADFGADGFDDGGTDGPDDASFDASRDASVDASFDASRDGSLDASRDASVDASFDGSFDASRDGSLDASRDAASDSIMSTSYTLRLYVTADDSATVFLDGEALEDSSGRPFETDRGWNAVYTVDAVVSRGRHELRIDTVDIGRVASAVLFAAYSVELGGRERLLLTSADTTEYACSQTSGPGTRGAPAACGEDPWGAQPPGLIRRGAVWAGCTVVGRACSDVLPYSYFIPISFP